MTDAELCQAMAELWVDNGGDVDGISWCVDDLRAAVRAEIARRKEEDEYR